jgi:clan AA aspartic protease
MSLTMDKDAEAMGRITTQLIITNRLDQVLAARGFISPDAVRSVILEDVLVDTGATTLCLPADVIAQLGLTMKEEVTVATATTIETARLFEDARIALLDREITVECLEVPEGRQPLLGVIPMEALGVELDLQDQEIRFLPKRGAKTYYTA